VGPAVVVSGLVVGLDLEHTDERRADHDLQEMLRTLPDGSARTAATHWAREGERPHVALSVELVDIAADVGVRLLLERLPELAPRWALAVGEEAHGELALRGAATTARDAHQARHGGRAVRYPGVAALVGTMTVQELLDRSGVDRVRVLTVGDAPSDARVVTRGHVRPTFIDGELVLLTSPAVGGTLVPFESPTPSVCCADH